VFGNDDMLPSNYGYGDADASAYSGMNQYGAAAADTSYGGLFAGEVPEQTAMTPQQDRPRMRVVPNPGEYGYREYMAERQGVVIPDRSAYGDASDYGKPSEADRAKAEAAKKIAAMALRQPTVTPSSSKDDIKTLQRALATGQNKRFALNATTTAKDGVDGVWGSDTTEKLSAVQKEAMLPMVQQTTPDLWAYILSRGPSEAKLALTALKAARTRAGIGAAAGTIAEGALDAFTRTLAPPPVEAPMAVSTDSGSGGSSGDIDWQKWGLIAAGVVTLGVVVWAVARKD
jgi:hypothetical protein